MVVFSNCPLILCFPLKKEQNQNIFKIEDDHWFKKTDFFKNSESRGKKLTVNKGTFKNKFLILFFL